MRHYTKYSKYPPNKSGCSLNSSHPLARSLIGGWIFKEGAGRRVRGLLNSDITVNSQNGWIRRRDKVWNPGTTLQATVDNIGLYQINLPLAGLVMINLTSLAVIRPLHSNDNSTGSETGLKVFINTNGTIEVRIGDGGVTGTAHKRTKKSSSAVVINTIYQIGWSVRSTTDMDIYINGIDAGGSYADSGGAIAYLGGTVSFANGVDGSTSRFLNGDIYFGYLWNRNVLPSEFLSLSKNPYQFIRPRIKNHIYPVTAPAGATNINRIERKSTRGVLRGVLRGT